MQDLKKHITSFFPFAQKQLGFERPPKLFFVNDKQMPVMFWERPPTTNQKQKL